MQKKTLKEKELEIRLGNNISALANVYGEEIKDLSAAIGINYNTFTQYLRGERAPSFETLILISEHYKVSIDKLLKKDLLKAHESKNNTTKKLFNLQIGDKDLIRDTLDMLFPWFQPDESDSNTLFEQADSLHQKIVDDFIKTDDLDEHEVEHCMKMYEKAGEEGNIWGYANHLWWLALIGTCLFSITPQFYDNVKSRRITRTDAVAQIIQKGFLISINDINDTEYALEWRQLQERFTKEYKPIFDRNVYYLKWSEVGQATELADYYLALSYSFGFANQHISRIENINIGSEMMLAFAKQGNDYAIRYKKYLYPTK